ncbi:MAG: two-component sensor histidine kinase [Cyclobacteriaceae bacterium]|jgi:two-component sensor histidine kinase
MKKATYTINTSTAIPLLIGLVVLYGWYTKNSVLIQVNPIFAPMQFNTALSFVLSAFGLLLIQHKNYLFGKILLIPVGAIGAITIFEYILGFNIGVDELFMTHDIVVETSHPGRMAPNTALCFFLFSITCILSTKKGVYLKSGGILSTIVFGLGLVAFSGYFSGMEIAYGWGRFTSMAVHTSFAFILFGIATTIRFLAIEANQDEKTVMLPYWSIGYAIVLAGTIFLIDIRLSHVVSSSIFYVILILFGWNMPARKSTLFLAAISSCLLFISSLIDPKPDNTYVAVTNYISGIFIIWVTAILLYKIKNSLLVKDVLLRELYHRTKNNMQFLSSMLSIQSLYTNYDEVKVIIEETKSRILGMALVQEKLYQSSDLSQIDLKDYITDLVELLKGSLLSDSSHVDIVTKLENTPTNIDVAIPCGLIINELFTNAIKHGFPDNKKGTVEIELRKTGDEICISVTNNGVSIPAEFDFKKTSSYGLNAIIMLSEHQLGGSLTLNTEGATTFILKFKDTLKAKKI